MSAILLLLFSTIPTDTTLVDHFDKAEINHFYDDQGRHVFDQVIWYNWVPGWVTGHRIEAWRLVKTPNVYPVLNRHTNKYESLFYDNDDLRKVVADSMVESWTQYDPELVGRETWPKEKRRDLSIKLKQKPKEIKIPQDILRWFLP